jgi:hypothetical protein
MEVEGASGLVARLVGAAETREVRRQDAMAGVDENRDHAPIEVAPGRLAVQAEESLGRIARACIDVVQRQPVRPLEIARCVGPIGQVGEFVLRGAQGVDQIVYPAAMNVPSKSVPQKDGRDERLAAALRENLRRRKAQARAKQDAKPEDQPDKSPRK